MKNRKLYTSIQNLLKKPPEDPQKSPTPTPGTPNPQSHPFPNTSCSKPKPNFAEQYCKQQMKRKKLIPKNCTSKIDDLMKNFKKINTYVDVDDLIQVVNQLYIEEERVERERNRDREMLRQSENGTDSNTQQPQNTPHPNPRLPQTHKKHTSHILQPTQPKILQKAKQALKQYHQGLYIKQNEYIRGVVEVFEDRSNYLCELMSNRQGYGFVAKYNQYGRRKMEDWGDGESREEREGKGKDCEEGYGANGSKQKWNLYGKANNYPKTEPNQDLSLKFNGQIKGYQPIQKYKKKKKMFDLAQIYLQMILQEQYRKKWNKDCRKGLSTRNEAPVGSWVVNQNCFKSTINEDNCEVERTGKKSSLQSTLQATKSFQGTQQFFFQKNRDTSNQNPAQQKKPQLTHIQSKHQTPPLRQNTPSASTSTLNPKPHPTRWQSRSNTKTLTYTSHQGNRPKQLLINKINNFLQDLQQDETCLKNQKKLHLNHLEKLERHIDEQNSLRSNKLWRDQEKCQQIRNVLSRFERK